MIGQELQNANFKLQICNLQFAISAPLLVILPPFSLDLL
jgi:hypothetical protein